MNTQEAGTISNLLNCAKDELQLKNKTLENLYIYAYSDRSLKSEIALDDVCFIDDCPDIDEHNIPIFPKFVIDNNLEVIFSGETLVAVVVNALKQKRDVTNDELLRALNHYLYADGFINFSQGEFDNEWYGAILLNVSHDNIEPLLINVGLSTLQGHKEIFFPEGTVLYSSNERCDVSTLSSMCARKFGFGLRITIDDLGWDHMLYAANQIVSPAQYIPNDQAKKKKPKFKIGPIPSTFQSAFPHTDIMTIRNYICEDKDETSLIRKNGQLYVRAEDRYSIDEPKQGFDFIRYLGFDIDF